MQQQNQLVVGNVDFSVLSNLSQLQHQNLGNTTQLQSAISSNQPNVASTLNLYQQFIAQQLQQQQQETAQQQSQVQLPIQPVSAALSQQAILLITALPQQFNAALHLVVFTFFKHYLIYFKFFSKILRYHIRIFKIL